MELDEEKNSDVLDPIQILEFEVDVEQHCPFVHGTVIPELKIEV